MHSRVGLAIEVDRACHLLLLNESLEGVIYELVGDFPRYEPARDQNRTRQTVRTGDRPPLRFN